MRERMTAVWVFIVSNSECADWNTCEENESINCRRIEYLMAIGNQFDWF